MPGPGEISGHLRITRIPTANLFGVGQSWLTQHKTLRLESLRCLHLCLASISPIEDYIWRAGMNYKFY
jgi:hypothetical protein